MWYVFLLVLRDLVRDHGKAVVELHGVAVDDFAIESTGYLDG
jgi:hypothetical protein